MEQNYFWEPDSILAGQEITRLLWDQKNHYRVHNPPMGPILSQLNQVDTLTTCLFKAKCNFNLSYTLR